MTESSDPSALAHPPATRRTAAGAGFAWLRRSGYTLVGSLLFAQAVFVAYLLASYGRTTVHGNMAAWSRFSAKGWVPGDTAGNTAMALHVGGALLVLVAGVVQLLPVVRRRAPGVHRWSGRLYLAACLVGAVTGLWLVWGRGTVGDLSQHLAISINALLLLACTVMAWRTARARVFAAHRVWAIRTVVTANGVLFFRVFLALWLAIFRAPVGFDAHAFSGPFLTVLAFSVYVFGPLTVYEMYRLAEGRAEGSRQPLVQTGTAAGLLLLSLLLVAGTGAAALILWLPRLGAG